MSETPRYSVRLHNGLRTCIALAVLSLIGAGCLIEASDLPWDNPYDPESTFDYDGDGVAYRRVDTGEEITFAQWDAAANRLARGLQSIGVGPGDRVALYLDGDAVLGWITAYAAIHKAGAVAVPTNTRLSAEELAAVLGHAEPVVVITSEALALTLEKVSDQLPSVRHVLNVGNGPTDPAGFGGVMSADDSPLPLDIGDDDLADINATFLQPFVSFTNDDAWTFSLQTETVYDWESEEWAVPINTAVSKLLAIGGLPISIQGGLRYWAESADSGPEDLGFRLGVTFLFPR